MNECMLYAICATVVLVVLIIVVGKCYRQSSRQKYELSLEQEKWVKAYLKVYLSFYRSVYNTPINNFFIEKFTFETAPIYTLADLVKTYIMNYSGGGVSQTQAEIERELISCFRKYNILQLGMTFLIT